MIGTRFADDALEDASLRLTRRMLAQWLTIHGFIAKAGIQASAMATAVGAADELDSVERAAVRNTPRLEEILAQLERGWNLLADVDVQRDVLAHIAFGAR
jgi:hypothetical protein